MQGVGALHVVLEKLVARSEVTELDRRCAQTGELAPEILLVEPRGVVTGADRLDLLCDLGPQLVLDLRLLPPQLQRLRVLRAEPPLQTRALRPQLQQGEVQLLDARTIEEEGEQVAVLLLGERVVLGLELDPRPFRPREQARDVGDPLGHGLLLFVDSDVRVLGCKAAQGRLAALHLLPRLVELAPEELLGRDVVGAARLFVGLQVRLGVCRREKGRQGGVRGREPHLHDVAPAHLLDREIAHVAVDERRIDRRPSRRLRCGGSGRGGLETARTDGPRHALAQREQPVPPRARVEEGVVRRKPAPADDALRKIPAPQRRHLHADEGRGAVRVAVALAQAQHVALEAQLDG